MKPCIQLTDQMIGCFARDVSCLLTEASAILSNYLNHSYEDFPLVIIVCTLCHVTERKRRSKPKMSNSVRLINFVRSLIRKHFLTTNFFRTAVCAMLQNYERSNMYVHCYRFLYHVIKMHLTAQ